MYIVGLCVHFVVQLLLLLLLLEVVFSLIVLARHVAVQIYNVARHTGFRKQCEFVVGCAIPTTVVRINSINHSVRTCILQKKKQVEYSYGDRRLTRHGHQDLYVGKDRPTAE